MPLCAEQYGAPYDLLASALAAFAIHALYNDDDQVTIRASIAQDTPGIIAALLNDSRTNDNTATSPNPADNPPSLATVSQAGPAPHGGGFDPRS